MSSSRSQFAALALAATVIGCSGGADEAGPFRVVTMNVSDDQVWPINRPIKVAFSEPVDPLSVNLNSFNVRRVGGGPAAGEFYFENAGRTIVFQPLCPTQDDLSDSGLLAGLDPANGGLPYRYELNVLGTDENSPLPIRSAGGAGLSTSHVRRFRTPSSLESLELYLDPQIGPPTPLILGESLPQRVQTIVDNDPTLTQDEIYSFVEVGGPDGARHFFRRDANGAVELVPPLDLPLNKLSDARTSVELVLQFDQPVNPAAANVSPNRLRWEFADDSGGAAAWRPLATNLELERNCGPIGARVRIRPRGALPPSTRLRAVVGAEFTDLVGEHADGPRNDFALARTEPFPTAPALLADHVLENFDSSAHEDTTASFAEPLADWGPNGELRARSSFTGTGGLGGGIDWYIGAGEDVIFSTTNTTFRGGQLDVAFDPAFPNDPTNEPTTSFVPTNDFTVIGGVVDVRNFYLEEGATLKIEGPNPFVLLATGDVWIRGQIIASGGSNLGVNTLNTANMPEPGAPGHAGGGRGGTGSPFTSASSPRGGNGQGAFGAADGGGQGGETGWSTAGLTFSDRRRGAGGGGGRFGPDVMYFGTPFAGSELQFEQRRIGYDAEKGFDNLLGDNGATSGAAGPFGGAPGAGPFFDPDPDNDFFGVRRDDTTGELRTGELNRPWAGAGGGAGGDATHVTSGSFPPPWSPANDEKGAGGAGGGGSVHILTLGSVYFGDAGRLLARGGAGGGGENVPFGINRVGGGSGGGSGGHVVLQAAGKIDLRAKAPVNLSDLNTTAPNSAANGWAINALGGQGGAGAFDIGGATQTSTGQRETNPQIDACPPGYPTSGANACVGQINGAGGDGGPGLVQFHTSSGAVGTLPSSNDVVLPAGATLDRLCAPAPLCAQGSNGPAGEACHMLPTFGRTSRARSKWIALGEGGFVAASGAYRDIEFAFGGVDPLTGSVLTSSGAVGAPAALLQVANINLGGAAAPYIEVPGGRKLVLDASAWLGTDEEVLLDNPALLDSYSIELRNDAASAQRFDVVSASYDGATRRLTLFVDGDGPSLLAFPGLSTSTDVSLHPTWFRVFQGDAADWLAAPADVQIRFQTTRADAQTGLPDPAQATPPTSDIAVLNAAGNGDRRFVRFEVLFDLGQLQPSASGSSAPALKFLRLPFRYRGD
jgi:hypothetical protein